MPSVPVVPVLPTVPLVAPEKRKTPPQQPTEAGVPEAEKKKTPTKQDMDVITVAPENQQKKATPPKQDLGRPYICFCNSFSYCTSSFGGPGCQNIAETCETQESRRRFFILQQNRK